MNLRSDFALVSLLPLLACPVANASLAAAPDPPSFKIKVEQDGAYRIDFDDLAAAGYRGPAVPSERLSMSHRSSAVAIWVEDGGDGEFGPGDWIEFVGEHLRGEVSTFDEHTRYNVYWLHTDSDSDSDSGTRSAPRLRSVTEAPASGETAPEPARLVRRLHFEEDLLRIRLPSAGTDSSNELWYWQKLVVGQASTLHELDLADLASTPTPATNATTTATNSASTVVDTVTLRVEFVGWSTPTRKGVEEIRDHMVQLRLNGADLTTESWNGNLAHRVELEVPLDRWIAGANRLELEVPKRRQGDGKLLVDVVLLNWIEVEYPHSGQLSATQVALSPASSGTGDALATAQPVRLWSAKAADRLLIYGDGTRRELVAATSGPAQWTFVAEAGERTWLAARPQSLLSPESVSVDQPSRLSAVDQQADYLMISHSRFLTSLEPLVALHQRLGRTVTVVDVEDIYDEFNDGIVHPRAIRDFLAHAYHHWQAPAPRFVLLVGDASWDGKNHQAIDENYADWTFRRSERQRFAKNESTRYADGAELNQRHYIPTWGYGTSQGNAASDNYFVAVDGDDDLPEMAIGRFTVVEPAEVDAIVAKTIRYVEQPSLGDWQRRVLFITNESEGMQRRSDRVVDTIAEAGFEPIRVYPNASQESNEAHTAQLVEAFDDGVLAVHFLGHGGRYIWRTGPPDLAKNHDLFTLDHLEQLAPTPHLPVIISLTCYSAPFDHPNADSIGEKFLRMPDRGAIGVVAASWRNSPAPSWGQDLLAELTLPGATVGEALMRAKHSSPHAQFVNTYNLLGDPGVPVALPQDGLPQDVLPEAVPVGTSSQATSDIAPH